MPDWKKVTQAAQTALTLDEQSLTDYLERIKNHDESASAITQLINQFKAPRGFMVTSEGARVAQNQDIPFGTTIGVWEIAELIGTGGMGEVYRALRSDGLYEQTVALKLMQSDDPTRALSFEQERRRLAAMEHPHIARIIDGGVAEDGRPFLAMEHVDGAPITEYAQSHGLSQAKRLMLFAQLCDAVGHAHGKLILHRDIKSPNVLVDSNGNVRLIDFGIASDLGEGNVAGGPLTLASAAPEQLLGESLSVATDVHALGVLLHELLTESLPERQSDGSMKPVASAISNTDLLAIVTRSLAYLPGERYTSAAALAGEVRAVLESRPVEAREGGLTYRASRLVQRYPLASALSIGLVLALTIGLMTSLSFARKARDEANRATQALELAKWQNDRTEASLTAQQAYSDVLQRSFGGDEDTEKLSQAMITRWQEVMENRTEDPQRAASLSYALGRNFYFRGDTRRALEVFEPWMSERFGPESLLAIGEEVYALMLVDGSRPAEAEPILRKLIDRYEQGFTTGKANLFNYAFKLARITRDRADIDRAEALVMELIETDVDPFETLFHHNQLGFLRMAKGDRDSAYDAFKVTVRIFEENPSLAAYGRDIARFNLASQELGWKRDLAAANVLVEKILTEDVALKGESLQKGRALFLQALIRSERNNHSAAQASIAESVELLERFSGQATSLHIGGLCIQAVVQAGAGDAMAAQKTLNRIIELTSSLPDDDDRLQKLSLTQTLVAVIQGASVSQVGADLASDEMINTVRNDSLQFYFYQRLVALGVTSPLSPKQSEAP